MIRCAHSDQVDPTTLKPNPQNPNTHPAEQIALLAKIIHQSGWRHPIVVSKRSGYIVMGHGRHLAALELQESTVPVDYQDFDSGEAELAAMVADNRIAELAELDKQLLKDCLESLDTGVIDLDTTGYDERALERILAPLSVHSDDEPKVCPHCGGAL